MKNHPLLWQLIVVKTEMKAWNFFFYTGSRVSQHPKFQGNRFLWPEAKILGSLARTPRTRSSISWFAHVRVIPEYGGMEKPAGISRASVHFIKGGENSGQKCKQPFDISRMFSNFSFSNWNEEEKMDRISRVKGGRFSINYFIFCLCFFSKAKTFLLIYYEIAKR